MIQRYLHRAPVCIVRIVCGERQQGDEGRVSERRRVAAIQPILSAHLHQLSELSLATTFASSLPTFSFLPPTSDRDFIMNLQSLSIRTMEEKGLEVPSLPPWRDCPSFGYIPAIKVLDLSGSTFISYCRAMNRLQNRAEPCEARRWWLEAHFTALLTDSGLKNFSIPRASWSRTFQTTEQFQLHGKPLLTGQPSSSPASMPTPSLSSSRCTTALGWVRWCYMVAQILLSSRYPQYSSSNSFSTLPMFPIPSTYYLSSTLSTFISCLAARTEKMADSSFFSNSTLCAGTMACLCCPTPLPNNIASWLHLVGRAMPNFRNEVRAKSSLSVREPSG
ncbi:hypothetical protein BKA70DRAFT_1336447 [Coprinopsis sp. MPI-PUGE-AT-0042]|nr:hypothetical protein BKA70DRAFT_1336447 [Coprinopsis sp. MPI-PUGE-AT-0042]